MDEYRNQDFITRKEFDERHTALQLQLAKTLGVVEINQQQITNLTKQVQDIGLNLVKAEKQIVISSTMNKVLWPLVSILVATVGFLLGTHI